MNKKEIVGGLLLTTIGTYGTSFVVHSLGAGHWASFPTFLLGSAIAIIGLLMMLHSGV
jgi:hypothetical protein